MIRTATLADVPAIISLWNEMITNTTVTFTTLEKTSTEIGELVESNWPVLVIENAGRFAGFACLSMFRTGPGYSEVAEHTIYLSEQARGKGLGHKLLQELEKVAWAAGFRTLVGAISGSNPTAVAFHERLGFEQVGFLPGIGRKWDRKIDLVLVQKNL